MTTRPDSTNTPPPKPTSVEIADVVARLFVMILLTSSASPASIYTPPPRCAPLISVVASPPVIVKPSIVGLTNPRTVITRPARCASITLAPGARVGHDPLPPPSRRLDYIRQRR